MVLVTARQRGRPFNNVLELLPNPDDEDSNEQDTILSPEEQLLRDLVNLAMTIHDDGQVNPLTVVRECRRLKTPVIVAGVGNFPRNGGCKYGQYVKAHRDTYRGANGYLLNRYTVRDRWLVDNAQIGLFVWNGDSPGTKLGYDYMVDRGKDAHLINFSAEV